MPFMSAASRAITIWILIQANPFSVAFKRTDGTTLAAQTIRLEYDKAAEEPAGAAGQAAVRNLVLFGVRNHPTVADTKMQKGYRFTYNNREYTVLDPIFPLPGGEVQARAEAVTG